MIELHSNELVISFPDIDAQIEKHVRAWIDARYATATGEEKSRLPSGAGLYSRFQSCIRKVRATVSFQRTLRIPDDDNDYPLPPGLGCFQVRHVDDFERVPYEWRKRGGVMLPMHRTEAMWLSFSTAYPMALKVGAGGICAVSGQRWSSALANPTQNYVVLPEQPWLDGFRVSEGVIRQFVAMPLGKGLTVERQLTGDETWGGLQLQAFPLAVKHHDFRSLEWELDVVWNMATRPAKADLSERVFCCMAEDSLDPKRSISPMGLGAGGRMRQEITADPHGPGKWDMAQTSRCFVHLCLADDWLRLTGTPAPHRPLTAKAYTDAGLPWFEYNGGKPAVTGETVLSGVKAVKTLVEEKTGLGVPDNDPLTPGNVANLSD